MDYVNTPSSQRDLIGVILLLVDLSQTAFTCGCTSPTSPLFLCTESKTVMNLGHLVKGQYCWSAHLPSRSARCYWGRQRLLFLIIACCQKPLVFEYLSSGTLAGWGGGWRSGGRKVKENVPCVPPPSLCLACSVPGGPYSVLHTQSDLM